MEKDGGDKPEASLAGHPLKEAHRLWAPGHCLPAGRVSNHSAPPLARLQDQAVRRAEEETVPAP